MLTLKIGAVVLGLTSLIVGSGIVHAQDAAQKTAAVRGLAVSVQNDAAHRQTRSDSSKNGDADQYQPHWSPAHSSGRSPFEVIVRYSR
jgi:hypothetical protein